MREPTTEEKINALVWAAIDGFLDYDRSMKIISRYVNERMDPVERATWLEQKAQRQRDTLELMGVKNDR